MNSAERRGLKLFLVASLEERALRLHVKPKKNKENVCCQLPNLHRRQSRGQGSSKVVHTK